MLRLDCPKPSKIQLFFFYIKRLSGHIFFVMATGCLDRRVASYRSYHLTKLNIDIMSVLVAKEAPDFKAAAAMPDGSIGEIQLKLMATVKQT